MSCCNHGACVCRLTLFVAQFADTSQDAWCTSTTQNSNDVKSWTSIWLSVLSNVITAQIVDKPIQKLAPKYFNTRFCRVFVENVPWLVERLGIKVLPCVISFVDGVSRDRQVLPANWCTGHLYCLPGLSASKNWAIAMLLRPQSSS